MSLIYLKIFRNLFIIVEQREYIVAPHKNNSWFQVFALVENGLCMLCTSSQDFFFSHARAGTTQYS